MLLLKRLFHFSLDSYFESPAIGIRQRFIQCLADLIVATEFDQSIPASDFINSLLGKRFRRNQEISKTRFVNIRVTNNVPFCERTNVNSPNIRHGYFYRFTQEALPGHRFFRDDQFAPAVMPEIPF